MPFRKMRALRIAGAVSLSLVSWACSPRPPSPPPSPPPAPAAAPRAEPSPAASPSASHRPAADGFEVVPLASGVYAFVAHASKTPIVSGNSLVVVGDDGVLVVDTGQFPALARRMIAAIRGLMDKPVRFVVNTHWHNDHVFGNGAYRDAFPGVRFVAQAETRRLLLKNGPGQVDTYRTKVGPFVASLAATLARGAHDDGSKLGEAERAFLAEEIADGEAALPLWREAELVPPSMTFETEMTLTLGRREVKLLHFGRGNTAGDAMVYVPDAKVLATGDVLVAPVPFAIGSYPREWARVLDRVPSIGASTLLPGHGAILHDASYAAKVAALLRDVSAQVDAAVAAGATLDETRARVRLDAQRAAFVSAPPNVTPDATDARTFHEYFEMPAVARAYQEAKGTLEDE